MDATHPRVIALVALAIVLALPANAVSKGGVVTDVAAKGCLAEKRKVGKRAFKKRYGEKATMTSCIRKNRAAARQAVSAATAECEAELLEWGLEGFLEDWDSLAECIAVVAEVNLGGGDDEESVDAEEEEFW